MALNRLIRGWCEYYRCTNDPSWAFDKIQQEIYWDFAHWLGRKYKISMPKVVQRYQEGSTFRTKATKLVMPFEYKAKRFVARTWHNPYTAPEKVQREKERIKRESLFSY